jgi:hypothetical protein
MKEGFFFLPSFQEMKYREKIGGLELFHARVNDPEPRMDMWPRAQNFAQFSLPSGDHEQ